MININEHSIGVNKCKVLRLIEGSLQAVGCENSKIVTAGGDLAQINFHHVYESITDKGFIL
ncbi:hypothetical protein MESS4_p20009 [Mesorhizobium sp. STM 4661]|nr:hypothetical protein MESS4_p20009 [Mesorhizobium sp. STM 4661]